MRTLLKTVPLECHDSGFCMQRPNGRILAGLSITWLGDARVSENLRLIFLCAKEVL